MTGRWSSSLSLAFSLSLSFSLQVFLSVLLWESPWTLALDSLNFYTALPKTPIPPADPCSSTILIFTSRWVLNRRLSVFFSNSLMRRLLFCRISLWFTRNILCLLCLHLMRFLTSDDVRWVQDYCHEWHGDVKQYLYYYHDDNSFSRSQGTMCVRMIFCSYFLIWADLSISCLTD